MELLRLSEQMNAAKNPGRYHRMFERAVRNGELAGVVQVADRIKLPPSKKGGKVREVADYAVLPSTQFAEWHERTLLTCSSTTYAPTFDALKNGAVDWQDAEQQTRKILDRRQQRNQKLKQQREEQKTSSDTDS